MEATPTERAYHALRHRDFRVLWVAELASSLGTRIQSVAIAWHVYQLTGDPFQLGILGLCRFVPILLLGIAGGVVADRGDRRRTLMLSQAALLMTSAMLATLTVSGSINMPFLYGITALSASCSAVANPTRHALVPNLVPRRSMTGAMTMNILGSQVAAVSGPAVGGVIVGSVGLGAAYIVDAFSFAIVIGALLVLRTSATIPPSPVRGFAAALEGIRFLKDSPVLLGVMVLDFVATFFGASSLLMPIFAEEVLGVGAAGLGLLLSAPAAGAVIGGAVMGVARSPRRPGVGVLVAVALYGGCLLGFGLSETMWLSLAMLAGSGAADAVSMALRHAVRNLATPDALRGRIAAAHSTFAMGGPQLGEFEAGSLAAVIGAGPSVAIGGMGTVLAAGIIAWRVPAIARYRVVAELPSMPTTRSVSADD